MWRPCSIFVLFAVALTVWSRTARADHCERLLAEALQNYNELINGGQPTGDSLAQFIHGNKDRKKCLAIKHYMLENEGHNCVVQCGECMTEAPNGDNLGSACDPDKPVCSPNAPYRTYDGSCNNLDNPTWGQFSTPQARLVPNAYDDGKNSVRTQGCSGPLPGARAISNLIHRAGDRMQTEPNLSYMVMQFGQFLAHDVILTKTFNGKKCTPLECCGKDSQNEQCATIEIPDDDPHFEPGECMNFQRSLAKLDCEGVRQQINSQTAVLDLSMVYGPTKEEAFFLRKFQNGLLRMKNGSLPPEFASSCRLTNVVDFDYYCMDAGDPRLMEQPGLAALHTVFARYHNTLALKLKQVNPSWNDERLYQEARRINIAIWENIVYSEYLPVILGEETLAQFDLNMKMSGYDHAYQWDLDPTILNEFGIAFRMGHSQINKIIALRNRNLGGMYLEDQLDNEFFNPYLYHFNHGQGYKDVLDWTVNTGCPHTDRMLESSVHDLLFKDGRGISFDLAALNIQRSRDHGLAGYNVYRKLCGLPTADHFGTGNGGLGNHEPEVASMLEQLYSCPGDIDLFTAILTEKRMSGGVLGPLGQCIMGLQFRALKQGDRFFFTEESGGLTKGQLRKIKKMRLANVLCEIETVGSVHRNVFHRPGPGNRDRKCEYLKTLNMNEWRE